MRAPPPSLWLDRRDVSVVCCLSVKMLKIIHFLCYITSRLILKARSHTARRRTTSSVQPVVVRRRTTTDDDAVIEHVV